MSLEPPDFAAIEAAARRLEGIAVRTPLLESPLLNRQLGFRLLVKAECLQRTGSFKFRGAYNRLVQFDPAQRARGVVAFSSGNHAQGVAHAAERLGIPAVIVMPADAPALKLANTRAYGAEVVTYDRWREDREAVAGSIAAARGLVTVKPYDDPDVMAGQGTVGLEIAEQTEALGLIPDAVVVCASGGGLVAGCALALSARMPATRVYCAEPTDFDDHARSLAAGERLANAPGGRSICDALLAATPGEITFPVNRRLLAGGLVATDAEVRAAMAMAMEQFKLVIEPGGAVAFATVLAGRLPEPPEVVVAVASGGNIDLADLRRLIG
jgi:threonine dehydratase